MDKKTIYILGNILLDTDNMPMKIVPLLKKKFPEILFMLFDPTEEFQETGEKNLIFIDTVVGIQKPESFNGLTEWKRSPRVSVHDFDLPIQLGLMQKIGKIKSITIIGVPPKGNLKMLIHQVGEILTTI